MLTPKQQRAAHAAFLELDTVYSADLRPPHGRDHTPDLGPFAIVWRAAHHTEACGL